MICYKQWRFSQSQNVGNTNPRINIQYFDIVLLLILYHKLQISDGRTDIQVITVSEELMCIYNVYEDDDDGHKVMRKGYITSYDHAKKTWTHVML
jgi:hypothetical protein